MLIADQELQSLLGTLQDLRSEMVLTLEALGIETEAQHHEVATAGQAEIDMRETFAPVFEDYGVDVVYSGHAHTYERSWYLHGHYGLSDTFDPAKHAELNSEGKPALGQGEESYRQITSSGKDDKAVYTVSGSAGKADQEHPCPEGQHFGCTREDWLMHPAHRSFDSIRCRLYNISTVYWPVLRPGRNGGKAC